MGEDNKRTGNDFSSSENKNTSQPITITPIMAGGAYGHETFPPSSRLFDSTNPKDLIGSKKVSTTKLPSVALLHGSHAMMNGAEKYGPYNWRDKTVKASIYIDAAYRHLGAWFDGEEYAEDSGVHHLGHAIACMAIILDARVSGSLVDDRPHTKEGGYLETLKEINRKLGDQG